LLTGKSPFPAESTGEYFAKILSEAPMRLRDYWPDAPLLLEQVISRCLRKDPTQRYGDVRSLVEALAPLAPEKARLAIEEVRSLLPLVPQEALDPLQDAQTIPLPNDDAAIRVPPPGTTTNVPAKTEQPSVAHWKISALVAFGVVLVGLAVRSILFPSPNESPTAAATTSVRPASLVSATPAASSAAIGVLPTAPGSVETRDEAPAKSAVENAVSSPRNGATKAPSTGPGARTPAPQPSAQMGAATVSTGSKLPWSRDLDDKP
jgi:eukaryotic-like serine/threonine-protein kinase